MRGTLNRLVAISGAADVDDDELDDTEEEEEEEEEVLVGRPFY